MFEDDVKKSASDSNRKNDGRFALGNSLWKMAEGVRGAKRVFETPDELLDACAKYFQWVDENPLIEHKAFSNGARANLPKLRAMTVKSMCLFIGISDRTWRNYGDRDEFKDACDYVEAIIYEQKFAGAAAGLFNHAIIIRELGLADKKQVDSDLVVRVVNSYDGDDDEDHHNSE